MKQGLSRAVGLTLAALLASSVLQGCAQVAGIEDWTPLESSGPTDGGSSKDGNSDAETGAEADAPSMCESGTFRCNDSSLQQCGADGDGWTDVAECASPGLCDASAGICVQPVCTPAGGYRCSANELQQCGDDLLAWETVSTCASAALCDEASHACISPACAEGQYRCSEEMLEVCSADLTGWEPVETCALATYCDAVAGQCITPLCQPNEHMCDGKKLRICNADLDGWQQVAVCGPAEICDAEGGDCDICAQGAWKCSGAILQRCATDGQSWVDMQECATPSLCDAVEGTCDAASCGNVAPGTGSDCGAGGGTDCCATAMVAPGSFDRSNDATAPASVGEFRLDLFEVTVGRFRTFLAAGKGTQANPPASGAGEHPNVAGSGWDPAWNAKLAPSLPSLQNALECDSAYETWTNTPGVNEQRPMSCVTWFEAFAFCVWDGGRLLTEAEWNYAAAGGDEQRTYPWDGAINASRAAYDCLGDGSAAGQCLAEDILFVGSKSPAGNGRWGHADLAGNVGEWVRDAFVEPYLTPCQDCAALSGSLNVVRGGSFDSPAADVTTLVRESAVPSTRRAQTGIRCARMH